ncbi:hypothetical protein ABW19_dt0200264 [Dactylella cylindrospora]|nr:hypothetical protein ABW19_dt0200264 [Dactylella cylindrospora]
MLDTLGLSWPGGKKDEECDIPVTLLSTLWLAHILFACRPSELKRANTKQMTSYQLNAFCRNHLSIKKKKCICRRMDSSLSPSSQCRTIDMLIANLILNHHKILDP